MIVFTIPVVNEIVADFNLGTETEVDAIPTLQRVHIEPELRFAEQDKVSLHTLVVPQIAKTIKRTQFVSESDAPHLGQLKAVE